MCLLITPLIIDTEGLEDNTNKQKEVESLNSVEQSLIHPARGMSVTRTQAGGSTPAR